VPFTGLRGVGATVDVNATIDQDGVPQYFGQNQYFNVAVEAGINNPMFSLAPDGGSVGGSYVMMSPTSTGNLPVPILSFGSGVSVMNPAELRPHLYVYKGTGAGPSILASGWNRIGSCYTPILDPASGISITDSNTLGFSLSNLAPTVVAQAMGGTPNRLTAGGTFEFISGVFSTNDQIFVGLSDVSGNYTVGNWFPMNNLNLPIPFTLSGLAPITSNYQIVNYDTVKYYINSDANAVYNIQILNASLEQL
jgi:hypothetical protein